MKPVLAALVLLSVLAVPAPASARPAREVVVNFYDRRGDLMSPARVRAVMTAHGAGWANDALLDPRTLQDLKAQPLHERDGRMVFDLLERPVALALNWPTARGYSLVIIDGGGRGYSSPRTINFTYRAAVDARRRLHAMLAARPAYAPSAAFQRALAAANADLGRARRATTPGERGRLGWLALDRLAAATDRLLSEYGPALAHARLASATPWFGTTLDTRARHAAVLDLAQATTDPYGWVRIVFDPGQPPSVYQATVDAATSRGLKVMGEPIDSYGAARYGRARYLARFRRYVNAFPQIDAWEVGNEVNGGWVRHGIATKVADVASWIQANSSALVVLTLYWQVGTDAPRWSIFNWVRASLPRSVRAKIDVVLMSTYIEDAPLGLAFDQVMRTLHRAFPKQRLGIGELDYWSPDTSRAWWAFDRTDPTRAARRRVAAQYYAASLGYRYALGGGFWWYFAEEAPPDPGLRAAIRAVVDRTIP